MTSPRRVRRLRLSSMRATVPRTADTQRSDTVTRRGRGNRAGRAMALRAPVPAEVAALGGCRPRLLDLARD